MSPEKSAHVECYIERKRDIEIKDDIYIMLKHLDGDANRFDDLETPRLADAVEINNKKIMDECMTGRGTNGVKEYRKKQGELRDQRKLGYPSEKLNEHVYAIQVRKGLKKKDPFFDKLMKNNKNLLNLGQTEIRKKPFEDLFKKYEERNN